MQNVLLSLKNYIKFIRIHKLKLILVFRRARNIKNCIAPVNLKGHNRKMGVSLPTLTFKVPIGAKTLTVKHVLL